METIIKKIDLNEIDDAALSEAGEIIKAGGLVAFPTETVYGLGANALDREAAVKTYLAKGRPQDNPLIVHIADLDALYAVAEEVPEDALKLAEKFWPGPMTLILRKSDKVPYETTGGLDTCAVRMPDNAVALGLIRAAGGFVSAPSANTSGRPSPTEARHVSEDLSGKIDMILDGGSTDIGVESTIIDMTGGVPCILRPGAITEEQVRDLLGVCEMDQTLLSDKSQEAPKAPGMKYRHYAPKADLMVVEGTLSGAVKAIRQLAFASERRGEKVGIISTSDSADSYTHGIVKILGSRKNEETLARNLYKVLREFDEENVDVIFSEMFGLSGIGTALMNRLLKAAGHKVIDAETVLGLQKYRKIVFVCDSDSCRAPMAAELLKQKTGELLQEYEIASRGMVVLFPEPVNQKAEAIMKSKQMTLGDHTAKAFEAAEMTEDTLILSMDMKQKDTLRENVRETEFIYTLPEFVRAGEEVVSPYGGALADYGETWETLRDLIEKLVEKLNKEAQEL